MLPFRLTRTRNLLLLLVLGCPLSGHAYAKGGDTQPARTIFERSGLGACDAGLDEVSPCYGDDCQGSTSRCFKSIASYQQFRGCGGANQRGCTAGEWRTVNGVTGQACSPGLGEALGCNGDDCQGSNSRCFQSLAAYQQFQGCGGSTQRGCLAGSERPTIMGVAGQACSSGFEEAQGCDGGDCRGSSSRCFPSLAAFQQFQQCGDVDQRACKVLGERPTIGGIAGGACRTSDLLEVQGCSGNCQGSSSHCELKPTYTYLRCYYREDAKATSPNAAWVWALQPNSDRYAVEGYWYGQYGVVGDNVFYTATSQQELRNVCANTLLRAGLQRPVGFFAADTPVSFNYTIWTNDAPQNADRVNRIVVFGDSLSDTGNLYNLTNSSLPSQPGWYAGRFSNGPVWVEYLAESASVPLYNWAFGGATVLENKIPIPRLNQQVDSWQAYMRSAKYYSAKNTLFVLWIGANDITAAAGNVPALSADVESGVKKLIDLGARRFLILNLPDIAKSPEVQNANKARAPSITADVNAYNASLQAIADRMRNTPSRPKVVLFDAHDLIDKMLSTPREYGFSVTDRQCLLIDWRLGAVKYIAPHWASTECANVDAQGWVFWDGSHPTTAAHKVLADHLSDVVKPLLQ